MENINHLSLSGEWQATWGDGLHGRMEQAFQPASDPLRYLPMSFPGSIQANLVKAGILEDPRLGLNSLKARWVEEHFWILRKRFSVPAEAARQHPWLHIDVVDGVVQVILNGERVGRHANANRPADFDFSAALHPGENELVLLLESGLFQVADLPGADYNNDQAAILNKRQFLRQPQYQFGWDWNPRLVYFGLHGRIELAWGEQPRLRQVSVLPEVALDLKSASIRVRTFWFTPGDQPVGLDFVLSSAPGLAARCSALLQPGLDQAEIVLPVPDPVLWWPRGYGETHLYPLHLAARDADADEENPVAEWRGKTGLRRVEIVQPPHPEEGRYFHIQVNNQPVFCQGSNWVPPELSAFEADPAKVERLVDLAVEQNFNMLRLWGGAVWAGRQLLELCDERGLMLWHDLLFACSKYPADRPDFLQEVQREIAWGLREFSQHPSLVVWCGSNELEEGLWSWHYQEFGRTAPDYVLFHHLIPKLLAQIDPTRPYWPSSPYSDPANPPQDPTRGDQHPWSVSLHSEADAADFWRYRGFVDRFPNEGGVLGLSPRASLEQFLNGSELKPRSFAWEHHDNTVNFWYARPGVTYLTVQQWVGRSVRELSLDELALASGLVQAEGLKEYIRNYRRRWPSTSSAIYWDYTDSWPSVHGWGTLDYYLRRKPSFYTVRRAFAPVTVVLADEDEHVGVYIVNQSSQERFLHLEAGDFAPGGPAEPCLRQPLEAPPFSSRCVGRLPRDPMRISYVVLRDKSGRMLDWDRLLLRRPCELPVQPVQIQVTAVAAPGSPAGRVARYTSPHWVWSVVLDPQGGGRVPDDIFDLLPGVPYDLPLVDGEEPSPVAATGSGLLVF